MVDGFNRDHDGIPRGGHVLCYLRRGPWHLICTGDPVMVRFQISGSLISEFAEYRDRVVRALRGWREKVRVVGGKGSDRLVHFPVNVVCRASRPGV